MLYPLSYEGNEPGHRSRLVERGVSDAAVDTGHKSPRCVWTSGLCFGNEGSKPE